MQQNSPREPKQPCFLQRTSDIADRNSDPLGFAMGAGNMQQANGLSTHDASDRSFDQQHSVRESPSHANKKAPPPNGKKTKGRVKIKMEFIDNKLRRYTTFSKRKTGIMKKAYELSTLTGTQVMLLVASETGHVYTFATRKLQPMITSEAGKALIQTCLNSPDPPAGPGCSGLDQRMSATGFEETELTYSVGDECERMFESPKSLFPSTSSLGDSPTAVPVLGIPCGSGGSVSPSTVTSLPLLTSSLSSVTSSTTQTKTTKTSSPSSSLPTISMQLPHTTGFTTILTPGTRKSHSPISDASSSSQNPISVVQSSQQGVSVVSGNVVIPASSAVLPNTSGAVMYQTAQGLVYASPTNLPEGVILNIGQENGSGTPQFITIPVSLSLTAAQQAQLLQSQTSTALTQVTNASMPAFPSSVINKKDKSKK